MKIIVVGSGLAGVTVAETLAKNPRHDVTLVTLEVHGYYARPRLSHGIALGEEAAAKIVLKRFVEIDRVHVLAGAEAWMIDRERQRLAIRDADSLDYDILVLATGSAARIPPALAPSRPDFLTLNSLDDLLTLRHRHAKMRARGKTRWAVVGGGLIGCEVASDLHKAGDQVTIFHREARLIERQLTERLESHGTEAIELAVELPRQAGHQLDDLVHRVARRHAACDELGGLPVDVVLEFFAEFGVDHAAKEGRAQPQPDRLPPAASFHVRPFADPQREKSRATGGSTRSLRDRDDAAPRA